MHYYIGNLEFDSKYLEHHGIKGQQWGVRRFQNEDGSLTPEGIKRYGVGPKKLDQAFREWAKEDKKEHSKYKATAVAGAITGLLTAGVGMVIASTKTKKINEKLASLQRDLNQVKISQIEIDPGTKFVRTSVNAEESGNDRMYVGYDQDKYAADYYKNEWPQYLKKIKGDDNLTTYKNTYEVKTKLVAPSYEERRKIAEAMIESDKKVKTELGKAFAMDQMRLMTGKFGAKTPKDLLNELVKDSEPSSKENKRIIEEEYKKWIKDQIEYASKDDWFDKSDATFRRFTASIPTSGKLMGMYIKELKKRGYNCVFDDNANNASAFIVFNPKDNLVQVGSEKILP